MGKRARKKRRLKRILTAVLIVLVTGGAVAALHFLFVNEFYSQGMEFCDDRKILLDTFSEENDRRLISVIRKKIEGEPKTEVFHTKIIFDTLQKIRVVITEEPPAAQTAKDGGYLLFTKEGFLLGKTQKKLDNISEITGVDIVSYEDFQKPETAEEGILDDALQILNFLEKYEFSTTLVDYRDGGFYLPMEEITVSLGKAWKLDDKLTELRNQLPYCEGLHGVIHLESLDREGGGGEFYFTVE